ncbi:MAG TPA: adenylate/guanylate cyclase domain-containing protein [Actinomycetota bacterium]|nr:adenylate/guanylate cyclase domain-containing protein [Actinomycetota bacterium]
MLGETQYARRGDVHIAYQVLGGGDSDLVLVSEWFSHLEARWDIPSFGRLLRRLSSFSRLISFDKYGIGLSDPAPPGSLPTLEEWMDDVGAVMDAARSERAAILGAADGGTMAAMFAATYPDRTHSLVLGNSAARVSWAPDYPIGLPVTQQEMLIRLTEDTWGTPDFAAATNPSLTEEPSALGEAARYSRLAASPATAAAVMRMLVQLDVRSVLPSIRVPTLVMHRRDNGILTIENGRYLADKIAGARFVELPGADFALGIGDVESVVAEVEAFLTGTRASVDGDRVLATVLFTDIVGSTERAAELGDQRWRDVLDAHDRLAERQLARYRGTLVKATGDGLFATFDGPARAIACALALRDGLRSMGVEIRGGLHCGEIERRGPDVSGLAVHIAARVQAVARPGEVLVTRTVKDLVAGAPIPFVDRGPRELRGVPDVWHLYAVGTS